MNLRVVLTVPNFDETSTSMDWPPARGGSIAWASVLAPDRFASGRSLPPGYVIATMRSIARRARSASSGSTVIRCLPSRSESRTFSSVVSFM
jgi:hypothetical protein